MFKRTLLAASLALSFATGASATTLTGNITADDAFVAYLSTDNSVAGTELTSSNSWQSPSSFSAALTQGTTYYLHIAARDLYGSPSALLGSFNLSGSGFSFSNGTQSLVTNAADWTVNTTGFGAAGTTPYDGFGANGVGPWGTMGSIAPNARWIWSGPSGTVGQAYFSTTITAAAQAVPEPETYAMFLAGLGLMGFLARRKQQAAA